MAWEGWIEGGKAECGVGGERSTVVQSGGRRTVPQKGNLVQVSEPRQNEEGAHTGEWQQQQQEVGYIQGDGCNIYNAL